MSSHIIEVCEGERNYAEGFIWSYDKAGSDIALKVKNMTTSSKSRAICGIKEDSYIELPSVYSTLDSIGVQGANVSKCLNGKRNTAGEFSWKYLDNHILDLLNELEGTINKQKEKIHHSQISYNEDTCLISINKL